jgi:hypothetical protein
MIIADVLTELNGSVSILKVKKIPLQAANDVFNISLGYFNICIRAHPTCFIFFMRVDLLPE